MSHTEFAMVNLTKIAVSLTNPRKNFNPSRLTELAESIKAGGVHQPILLRPLPGYRVTDTMREVEYEIVSGERRYRASELATKEDIPAMIRVLTDDQVLEIQLVENLQRDDLTELEEAEGYAALMEHAGLSTNQVGAKIGKSNSYVYQRLKLLDLSAECKQAMRAGEIDGRRALLIARIPDSKLQSKALEEATRKQFNGDHLSVRDFQTWLQKNVMLRLEHATFKITDARLVEAAGSCKTCPKRTGANPDLFADVVGADICTDPACYHGKEEAHRNALLKMAEKKGMRVVEGEEAEEMLTHGPWSDKVDGYTPLGQIREDITVGGETGQTMRELLGADAPAPILFEHPRTKELMELVPTDEAEGVLLAKGLLKSMVVDQDNKKNIKQLEQELSRLQYRFNSEQSRATSNAIMDACVQAVRESAADYLITSAFLRAWLLYQLDNVSCELMAAGLGYTFQEGEDQTDGLTQHIRACGHADLVRAMVIVSLHEENNYNSDDDAMLMRDCITRELSIPVKEITAKSVKEVKDKFTPEIKAIQAQIDKANKPPVPLDSAAQPELAGGKVKKGGSKAKLSAEDAKSGIASAIQEMEQAQTTAPEARQEDQASNDPLYVQALELIIREQKASKRLFKEVLRIGQTKALQLLDQLEQAGKVTAVDERGARKVLVAA